MPAARSHGFLLLHTPTASLVYYAVSDTGVGIDAIANQAQVSISDSVVGTDTIVTAEAQATVHETGVGSDGIAAKAEATVQETGIGTEGISTEGILLVSDTGHGTDIIIPGAIVSVSDEGLGNDAAWRARDQTLMDEVDLPHVQQIQISEPSIVQDLPIMDALPFRKQLGKMGRTITIQGWTDSLATLGMLRGCADGAKHLLILPTGDSMTVHITNVQTPKNVEALTSFDYALTAVEVVD